MNEKMLSAGWSEHRFISFDETPIFYRQLKTTEPAGAVVLIQHGMGEHGGRYRELAEFLAAKNISSFIPDLRGFGKSGGKRGCVRRFSDYFKDLRVIQRLARDTGGETPFFLLGHSFGGLILSAWISAFPEINPKGLVLSSPNFGISLHVPRWRHWLALSAASLWPDITQDNRVNPDKLTHDARIRRWHRTDALIHNRISAGLYREMTRLLSRVDDIASKISCPALVLQAGDDQIVSRPATQLFFERLASQDKELEIYENLYHEILNEIDRQAIFTHIACWIQHRMGNNTPITLAEDTKSG